MRKQSSETVKKYGAKVFLDALLNAFVKILDDSRVKNTSGKRESHFTPSTLLSYLKENIEEKHDEFRNFLEKWISAVQNCEEPYCHEVLKNIRKYVREKFAKIWDNFQYEKVKEFLDLLGVRTSSKTKSQGAHYGSLNSSMDDQVNEKRSADDLSVNQWLQLFKSRKM